jgi:hypothetical protein
MKQTVLITGAQFLRFVFANEPVERLRSWGERPLGFGRAFVMNFRAYGIGRGGTL